MKHNATFQISLLAILSLALPSVVCAMGSTNYKIDSDVIGTFGAPSSSTNYTLNDTGGEVGTGDLSSASYLLHSGFWTPDTPVTIAISAPADVAMGSITGTGQSSLATNSAVWNIETNNPGGYSLSWQASAAGMTNGNSDTIAAYTPAVTDTPEIWSVAGSASEWGAHLGSTSTTVNTTTWGAADTYADGKWLNVQNTAAFIIANRNSATGLGGDDERVWFGAEIGASKLQPTGAYTVNVTMTAVTL